MRGIGKNPPGPPARELRDISINLYTKINLMVEMPPPGENPEQDPVGSYRILLGTRNFSGSFQDSSYRIHTQDPNVFLQDLARILTFS